MQLEGIKEEGYLLNIQHESNIKEICKTLQTNDPYIIADAVGMMTKIEETPKDVLAIYTPVGKHSYAVLSDKIDDELRRYTTALCLYYHLKKRPRLLMKHGPVDGDYSAAYFAFDLLSCCVEPYEGETSEEYDARIGIPANVAHLAKARLH